jgi:hypothetical protein
MMMESTYLMTLTLNKSLDSITILVFRDGETITHGPLLENKHLNAHLLSRGALSINSSGSISICFVGFSVWESWLLFFLPKGYPKSINKYVIEIGETMRLILQVLKKYSFDTGINEPDPRRLSRSLTDAKVSKFALAKWLADDFSRYGLYRKTKTKFTSSGYGVIDWNRTTSLKTAHISDGSVIYLNCITKNNINDDYYFLTRIHISVLDLCRRRYGGIINLDRQVIENEGITPLAEKNLYELGPVYLARELRHAYADRSINLLRMLDIFLKVHHPSSTTEFEIYGTSYFEHVWEKICSTVIGNDIRTWASCVPNPAWISNSGEKVEAASIRPDIIRQFRSNDLDAVLLADAKYYSITMPPMLSGNPGVGDIIKQLVYELAVISESNKRGLKFKGNFFIFPKTEQPSLFSVAGTASYEGISAGPIKIIFLDLSKAMKLYLIGGKLSDSEVVFWFE